MIRLILIDDHQLIRSGLKTLLGLTDEITVFADGCSIEYLSAALPECDVILINQRHLALADVAKLKAVAPQAFILVMSSSDEEFLAAALLSAGVQGYLAKEASGEELLTAIRKVATGLRYLSARIAQQLTVHLMTQPKKSLLEDPFKQLAMREMDCARLLAQGKSTSEIAEWMKVSSKTVNTYRHRIFQKLQVTGEVDLIKLAFRHGYLVEAA